MKRGLSKNKKLVFSVVVVVLIIAAGFAIQIQDNQKNINQDNLEGELASKSNKKNPTLSDPCTPNPCPDGASCIVHSSKSHSCECPDGTKECSDGRCIDKDGCCEKECSDGSCIGEDECCETCADCYKCDSGSCEPDSENPNTCTDFFGRVDCCKAGQVCGGSPGTCIHDTA